MDKFVVRGGNPLLGTIKVSGAKNSALPCMAAAILTEDEVILENIPQMRDIETERKLLVSMGANKHQIFFKAVVPSTIPTIIATFRINIGFGLVGAVVGEFISSQHGLGHLIELVA